jgi:hypothetical protein
MVLNLDVASKIGAKLAMRWPTVSGAVEAVSSVRGRVNIPGKSGF